MLNGLALSAGIGGLELGIRLAIGAERYRTACYVEWESYAASTLVARMAAQEMDDAPVWDDIKTFDGRAWRGVVDFLTAGYPCQPFSDAGLRRGTADPRHLFPHIARIIRECEPTICFFENVGAHLRLGFREVKSELENLHYRVEAGLFSAEQVGAPHERERLFILAIADRAGCGEMALPAQGQQSTEQANQFIGRSVELGNAEYGDDSGRNESELGKTRQEILQPRERTPGADRAFDGSATLENAATVGRRRRRDGNTRGRERASETLRYSGELDVAEHGRRKGQGLPARPRNEREGTTNIVRREQELEYTALESSSIGDKDRCEQFEIPIGKSRLDFPIFPPRPDDYEQWRAILSRIPFVAPAIQKASEPDVYRMADGTAVGVDESRYKEQLSCVGNAVSPIVAAFAFSVLAKRAGINFD